MKEAGFRPVGGDPIVGLRRLNAVERFSLSLWALPIGKGLDQVDTRKWPREYIQAAGSYDRLIVEVRRAEGGLFTQYAVGRPRVDTDEAVPRVSVRWNGCETTVSDTEVLGLDEVCEIFETYHRTKLLPSRFVLREVQL